MKVYSRIVIAALCAPLGLAQTTVTLKGSVYSLRDHPRVMLDGSAGPLTMSLAAKAVPGNPPWDAMVSEINSLLVLTAGTQMATLATGTFPLYQVMTSRPKVAAAQAEQAALICNYGNGTMQANACTMALWL